MDKLVLFNESNLNSLINKRPDESKFGEHITIIPKPTDIYEQLKNLDVQYIIFGIPEDVGVFANLGKSGTSKAWDACLKVLLNIQSNAFTHAHKVLILGHLDFSEELKMLSQLDQANPKDLQKSRKLVKQIDIHVAQLISTIVKSGKTPIVVGGGHNNAYGNIKGTSLALKKPINVINFDAHSDFRAEEGRHSGNGFSYAYSEGFLKKYFIFGLHENYTSAAIFKQLENNSHIDFNTFEALEIRKEVKFKTEINRALQFINSKPYGIELDCDAIQNTPSSAMSPSGFSVSKTRMFLNAVAQSKHAMYLHLCEAAPTPETEAQVGKLLTYLITDFIRSHANT
ncbi:formimidoylglutamase [Bizionia sp. M204]|uniref:formimidoylglutamase n=1 Tax=Bizionia sp. M204 TaxID=2675331 RepID=UPI002050354C|nr:formimidoylglutamase [Bizionia sp. M204]UPS91164.1 arginase [Bizionia sp. M204]